MTKNKNEYSVSDKIAFYEEQIAHSLKGLFKIKNIHELEYRLRRVHWMVKRIIRLKNEKEKGA